MRRAAKVDANQSEIVQALRRLGCTVLLLHQVGNNCPDILIGVSGVNVLAEIKDGKNVPSKKKLSPGQVEFRDGWKGRKPIALFSVEDAIHVIQEIRNSYSL